MDKWRKIPDFIRFLIIGSINAVISYIIYVIAVLIIGQAHYQICLAIQWIISSVISFLNQKYFVFCTKGNHIKEYLKCCSTWVVSYFLNVIILECLVKFVFKNVFVSQFIALGTVSVVTYILFKVFAFKQTKIQN